MTLVFHIITYLYCYSKHCAMMSHLCNHCVCEFLILARTWFAFGLPSKTGCDNDDDQQQDDDDQQQDTSGSGGSSSRSIYLRGLASLPQRPILRDRRPLIRPEGERYVTLCSSFLFILCVQNHNIN